MMPDLTHGLVGPDEQFGVNHPGPGIIEIEMYFGLPVLACCRALCPPPPPVVRLPSPACHPLLETTCRFGLPLRFILQNAPAVNFPLRV